MTHVPINKQNNDTDVQTHLEAPPLVTVLGPTASGKTALGVALAKHFSGEIISADSRQVYRNMDIGTGKDLDEYGEVPYHLIDIEEPGSEYNLFEFIGGFNRSFADINERNKLTIMVGGTGMYLDAILNRYKLTASEYQNQLNHLSDEELKQQLIELRPNQHNTTNLETRGRLISALAIALSEENNAPIRQASPFKPLTIGVQFPRDITRKRITKRLKQRLDLGMIEEVEALHANGLDWEQLDFYGLEYRFIAQYLQGKLNYNDMFQKLNSAIHQFAKQQEKWFRNIEKKGHKIHWLNMEKNITEQASPLINNHLTND